jgi:hypothetical protein
VRIDDGERGQHLVLAPGEAREHSHCIVGVDGFAEDRVIDRDGCVRNQDRRFNMAAGDEPRARRDGLGLAHPHDVVVRPLAGQLGFERLGVFIGTRQQQLVAYAELLQQFLTARALGCKVDERMQCGSGRGHKRSQ